MRFLRVLPTLGGIWPSNPAPQGALMDMTFTREKVPGDNPAYYSREKEADQLFEIAEFIVSPAPPLKHNNNRVFFYLNGTITKHYPGLANSSLLLRTRSQHNEYGIIHRISDAWIMTVRKDGVYGGPLEIGGNELVGDQEIMDWGQRKNAQLYIEVVARLPDERVLFAFEADVEFTI